jgi:hypothetical protein
MVDERHLMVCIGEIGTRSMFECTVAGCGREVALDHETARLVVLVPGAASALHRGSTGLVSIAGRATPAGPQAY